MRNFLLVLSSALLATQFAVADDVLSIVPGTQTCEGVTIAKSATLNLPDKQVDLTTVGYGLRKKKVTIINVKVYCASVLVSEPSSYVRSATDAAALASLDGMQDTAIRLDFLRGVDAATVKASFEEAMAANNVDTTGTNVKAFLDAVVSGGDAESGKTITIAGDEKSGLLQYEDTNGKIQKIQGDSKLLHDVFSIWFGVPADDGLAQLKQAIGE